MAAVMPDKRRRVEMMDSDCLILKLFLATLKGCVLGLNGYVKRYAMLDSGKCNATQIVYLYIVYQMR